MVSDAIPSDGPPISSTSPVADEKPWDPHSEQEHGIDNTTETREAKDRYASGVGTMIASVGEMAKGAGQVAAGVAAKAGMERPELTGLAGAGANRHHTKSGMPTDNESDLQSGLQAGPTLEQRAAKRAGKDADATEGAMDPDTPPDETEQRDRQLEDPKQHELEGLVGKHKASNVLEDDEGDGHDSLRSRVTGKARDLKLSFAELHRENHERADDKESPIRGNRRNESSAASPFGSQRHRASISSKSSPYTIPVPAPEVNPHGLEDPLDPHFYEDVWIAAAARNTEIFRKVFRCTPDDRCLTWTQFKEVGR